MSNYIVDGTDLTSVANAIRTKGGTSAQLAFPAGFVSAIDAIPTGGGGEITLLASGSYTQAEQTYAMTIPISYSGMPTQFLIVESDTEYTGQNRSSAWLGIPILQSAASAAGFDKCAIVRRTYGATEANYFDGTPIVFTWSNSSIYIGQMSSSYPIRPGTYTWYIWGTAE